MEFTLLAAALTGAGLLWVGTRLWPEGLPDHAFDRLIGAGATGLLLGRLATIILQGTNPIVHPGDLLIVRGGVNTAVASTASVTVYLWSVRWKGRYLDAAAAAVLLALAGWHAGCLWRGSCLGTPAGLPWAWGLPGSTVDRHPVEIYTAVLLMAGALIINRLGPQLWLRSSAALATASAARLLTDPLRPSLDGGIDPWYLTGLALGSVVVALSSLRDRPADLSPHPR